MEGKVDAHPAPQYKYTTLRRLGQLHFQADGDDRGPDSSGNSKMLTPRAPPEASPFSSGAGLSAAARVCPPSPRHARPTG